MAGRPRTLCAAHSDTHSRLQPQEQVTSQRGPLPRRWHSWARSAARSAHVRRPQPWQRTPRKPPRSAPGAWQPSAAI